MGNKMKCEHCKKEIFYNKKENEVECPFCGYPSSTPRGMFIGIIGIIAAFGVILVMISIFAPEKAAVNPMTEIPTGVYSLFGVMGIIACVMMLQSLEKR